LLVVDHCVIMMPSQHDIHHNSDIESFHPLASHCT
jgi:hypothetical protein